MTVRYWARLLALLIAGWALVTAAAYHGWWLAMVTGGMCLFFAGVASEREAQR